MEKIAVIGISCLLPGAGSEKEYWQNLLKNKDSRTDISREKMGCDPDKYFTPKKNISDKFYCKKGGFINGFKMTSSDLNVSKRDLSMLDDVFKWPLHTAREALRDSGYLGKKDILKRCGHILGNLSFPTKSSNHFYLPLYQKELTRSLKDLFSEDKFTLSKFNPDIELSKENINNAGRPAEFVSKALSLGGTNFALDAACASSIYAVKVACDYLLSGKEDLMLAGAVSAADPFFINMGFSIFQAYPEDGESNPLDKKSNGLFSSEGAGTFVLKRYSDALRDNDKIYAIIHGTGLSNDGKGQSVLSPGTKGQIKSFERAYENAGISPKDVAYVECHATGTPLGDKVEVDSIDTFFGKFDHSPKIGSVKSNLGHLLTAASMAGMIKVIMSLKENNIPATINLKDPQISKNGVVSNQSFLKKNTELKGNKQIAAVSGFGFGGTNGHIILEHKDKQSLVEDKKDLKKEKLKKTESKIAIVGMDVHFGRFDTLEKFESAIYDGKNSFRNLPEKRWMGLDKNSDLLKEYGLTGGKPPKGSYIESFDLDCLRFKIPPNPDDRLIPQQLLILKVADRALLRTNIKEGANVAVIIAMGTEPELHRFRGRVNLQTQFEDTFKNLDHGKGLSNITEISKDSVHNAAKVNQYTSFIGNIMASRLSSVWDFSGPSFTVSSEELSVFRAIEYAQIMLENSDVDAVVVGGVDFAGSVESVLLKTKYNGSFVPGEGAGAIVLKRYDVAEKERETIYGKIENISFSENIEDFKSNGLDLDYVEFATGIPTEKRIKDKLSSMNGNEFLAGSVQSTIGNCFTAAGIAGFIKTVICMSKGFLPANSLNKMESSTKSKDWNSEKTAAVFGSTKNYSSLIVVSGDSENKDITDCRKSEKRSLIHKIHTGGKIIRDSIVTEENRKKYSNFIHNKIAKKAEPSKISTNVVEIKRDNMPEIVEENLSLVSKGHMTFLKTRREAMGEISTLIKNQITGSDFLEENLDFTMKHISVHAKERVHEIVYDDVLELKNYVETKKTFVSNVKEDGVIWDEKDLLEFAGGKISNVFGKEYSIIDTYKRCVRLPLPPYLLVTRVTKLDGKVGEFKPSTMTTEYDIPKNSWYGIDGQIPWAVSVESGQCDLLLISYLGIDFECKGDRVYRLLDCTLTFLDDIPMEGDTLRYDISINSYARNGGSLLFFFSYECFVGDKMVLKMDGGCAGFFTDEELDAGKGIIITDEEIEVRKKIEKKSFNPYLTCTKKEFDRKDLLKITSGKPSECFGKSYDQKGLNASLRFASEEMLMIDRVVDIDINGGAYGLGAIHAEKILKKDDWYFPCHFKDDEVMAGSLMSEGCGQLLQFFLLYLGMQTQTVDARFQPIPNLPQKVRCRGQVVPVDAILTYKLEIKEIGTSSKPYAIADIDIILDGKIVVDFKNLGVQIKEKVDSDPYKSNITIPLKKELYTKKQLENFATGSLEVCFGEKYKIYEGRDAPRTPNGDLQLISRVMEFNGTPLDFKNVGEVVTEYDVPEGAWYFKDNSNPYMPYSVIMEIALQPCGFVSCVMETTLMFPETDFYFRNLDGKGEYLCDIDLRGKTITNKSRLLSTSSMTDTIIQTFDFELSVDGIPFYKGDAVFGYFVASALTNQVGLDNGIDNHPMTDKKYLKGKYDSLDLNDFKTREAFFDKKVEKPLYHLAKDQLDLLNSTVLIDHTGGEKNLGYIYADKLIDISDWYFKFHFFQDPVMPGSLGIETMLQAIQIYILKCDLGKGFKSPKFSQNLSETKWCYRGQINPEVDSMAIEVHITGIEKSDGKITVFADSSLWKEKIRIYEAKNLSVTICES
ncbi:MAG: 3-hydroxyacyl-[acyl-carrier-protein] dehydratase FabA [Deltaproteobacteria bacterium]|nr:3-hydroxyacyl-[acyl-carrier-protein] dehydratase FabA [Deltaproteobacteria bacterium]